MTTNGNVITGGSNEVLHSLHPRLKYPELWRGCVGAWCPSMGKTGEKLFDYSGYGNHGSLQGMDPATDWVTSDGKGALDFDGTDDHVLLTKRPEAQFQRHDEFSVSAWILPNTTATTAPGILCNGHGTPPTPGWFLMQFRRATVNATAISFLLVSNDTTNKIEVNTGAATIAANTLYHVAATYDGSSLASGVTLYINGIKITPVVTQDNLSSSIDYSLASYLLGGRLSIGGSVISSQMFSGNIFECFLHNRALSHQEIKILASSRGAAYQKRKVTSVLFSTGTPASNRRNNMLIGCGF